MRVHTWILSVLMTLSFVTMSSVASARDSDRNFDEDMQRHIWSEHGRVYYGPYGDRRVVKKYRWEHERYQNRDEMGIGSIDHPDRIPDHR
jgi:hypothetical protein